MPGEHHVWAIGGNLELAEAAMDYEGQAPQVWLAGGNVFIEGGGGGGFTPADEWDIATQYETGDVVTYNQSLYIATGASIGEDPPANSGLTHVSMQQFIPVIPVNGEAGDIEIGIVFMVDQQCLAMASKFYKGDATNIGPHVGRIWNADTGVQMTSETYVGETASGWQRQQFSTPAILIPGTQYIHSVSLPDAHYSNTVGLMRMAPFTDGPIRVGRSTFNTTAGSMPTTEFNDIFYFNAVEVNINIASNWQLLAKGDWGRA